MRRGSLLAAPLHCHKTTTAPLHCHKTTAVTIEILLAENLQVGQLQRGHFPGEASARGSKINTLLLPIVASELYNSANSCT